jgi:ATP-dependent RNA helicase RhlE
MRFRSFRSFRPRPKAHAAPAPAPAAHPAPHAVHRPAHAPHAPHKPEAHAHAHPAHPPALAAPPAEPSLPPPLFTDVVESGGVFALLLPQLQRAVAEEGYATPTPIQAQAIPHLLAGRDLLGCAQTGTGKTAAFALPILQYLHNKPRPPTPGRPRALVLAPTRELAGQIGDSLRAYGRHVRIPHTVIFGGVGQHPQVQALRHGVDIVVATPGRLLDLMNQRHLRLDDIEIFVLDEADRMLDMGFIHDIRKVIAALPAKRQSLFFSATLAPEVIALARTLVRDAVHVSVTPEQPTVERIAQKVLFVDKGHKDALLAALLRDPAIDKVLVFTRMKHGANRVAAKLHAAGIPATAIHGNKSQNARTQAMDGFRSGTLRVLVATDIAARGIDVDGITHVVNYDLPTEPETYVHRIGRTARAGADGDAVSFCCAEDRDMLREIEKLIRKPIPVDDRHAHHSEAARTATGAAARRPPQGGGHGGHRPPHAQRHPPSHLRRR